MAKPEAAPWLTASVIGTTALVLPSGIATAATGAAPTADFTSHWVGFASIAIFVLALAMVIGEEAIHMRKSKPVMVVAGIIWALVAGAFVHAGDVHTAGDAVRHNLLEFTELFLFLLAAMTYINSMDERGVFDALRAWLVSRG
ncbi:MAG: sodium:proton antiporter NhaD, partial [Rhodospirillales bacterium]|nr:sodium:proton antiporter NhaD [Rhodospirillales bacterium]